MSIDLKEIEKIIKLCRKHGVSKLAAGEISLELAALPQRQRRKTKDHTELSDVPQYNDEQLIDWSAGGVPHLG